MMKTLKLHSVIAACLLLSALNINAQEWMSNLKVAQKLALVQNKMVLMVWEGETFGNYPVFVQNNRGNSILIDDLFSSPELNQLIWQYFVPVTVPEIMYDDYYKEIKKNHSYLYTEKFNDASLKVMDANGYIVNVYMDLNDSYNLSKLIENYAFNTEYLSQELQNYAQSKTFYSSYFLALKYLDFLMYNKPKVNLDIINVAKIYMKNAEALIASEPNEKHAEITQRLELLQLHPELLKGKSGKVLRNLKKIDNSTVFETNKSYKAFLYYTAYKLKNKHDEAEAWKPYISGLDLIKAQGIVNINK